MPSHRYVLSAGHRNTDRGGAVGEFAWTPGSAHALKAAIETRGGKAWILQEEDGDGDREFFNGGLQAGARRCVELAKKHGPFDAYISSHYNGVPAGFHAIFPDGGNGDTKADNPLDVKLCRTMAKHVKAKGTVPLLGWTKDSPGVMSEKETGVGAQGYRLGEMVGTLGFRGTTARVIIEAGGIGSTDKRYITNPAWVRNVYAESIVDALEEVFGTFRVGAAIPKPATPPVDSAPHTVYAEPVKRAWVDQLRSGKVTSVMLPDGARWFAVDRMYQVVKETKRLQYALEGSREINEPIPVGTAFGVDAVGVNHKGEAFAITPWETVVDLDDLELVPWPDVTTEAA